MSSKIKILHLINSLGCGGIQRQMLNLLRHLDCNKFESFVLSYDGNMFFEGLEDLDIRTVPRDKFFLFKAVRETVSLINSREPDIVHVWNIYALPLLYAAWPFLKKKPVLLNGTLREAPVRIPPVKRLIAASFRFHKYIVANSESSLRSFGEKPGAGRFVVYNGFDDSSLSSLSREDALKQLGWPSDKFNVAMIASLSGLKDHKTFIEAAKLCLSKSGDIMFYIIGDGALREELESLVRKEGLSDSVIFTGHRKDIPVILRAIDLCVLLSPESHSEGFPNAMLEAYANGIPGIATRSGGSAELIRDGIDGYLVANGDLESIAEKIIALKNKDALRRSLSEKALERASLFMIKKMVSDFSKLYETVL